MLLKGLFDNILEQEFDFCTRVITFLATSFLLFGIVEVGLTLSPIVSKQSVVFNNAFVTKLMMATNNLARLEGHGHKRRL